jgi:hypothetical protein
MLLGANVRDERVGSDQYVLSWALFLLPIGIGIGFGIGYAVFGRKKPTQGQGFAQQGFYQPQQQWGQPQQWQQGVQQSPQQWQQGVQQSPQQWQQGVQQPPQQQYPPQ